MTCACDKSRQSFLFVNAANASVEENKVYSGDLPLTLHSVLISLTFLDLTQLWFANNIRAKS